MRILAFWALLALFMMPVMGACSSTEGEPDPTDESIAAAPTGDATEVAFATLPPPIVIEATNTAVPASATPEVTDTPEPTPTAEASATATVPPTNTPAPAQPTNPPPPPATAVPPTAVPAPTDPPPPPPQQGANGLIASSFALQDRSKFEKNQPIWFEFTVANQTSGDVSYNALGVMPRKDGVDRPEWYQQTFGGRNSEIGPSGFSWEDNIELPETGSYTLRLVICFDGFDPCLQQRGTWHTLSQEIAININ